jgi:hypothetical protein
MAGDFLLTWKPDQWPYSELRKIIDAFDSGGEAKEDWRFAAHRKVVRGDRVYLYKQGDRPRGVFARGTVTGVPKRNPNARKNERAWQVPVSFDLMVDPLHEFIVTEEELLKLPAPKHRWATQSSGITLEPAVARAIDKQAIDVAFIDANDSELEPFDPKNIEDARERIRRAITLRRGQREFRFKLLNAYEGKCAVTGCALVDVLEAAHIVPYKGQQTNDVRNGVLLRTDLHTLFDCGLFSIDTKTMRVMVTPRLLKTGYRNLNGRMLRVPKDRMQRPSEAALDQHRLTCFWK